VVQATSTDGSGNKVVVSTAYDAAGAVVYVVTSVTNPAGTAIANSYDDNGDGVVDRDQTATTYFGDRCDGTPRLSVVHRQPFRGPHYGSARRKGGRLAAHHECKRHLWRGQHVRQGRYRQYACDHLVLFREPHRSELGAHIDRLIGKHGQAA
jgi:hypothetical protein